MNTKPNARNLIYLLPIAFGIFAFFLIIGFNALNPTNIAWLSEGDAAAHYLGWAFFRNSPWTWPIGLNPQFGLDLSSGIAVSDSNSLFAFIFKAFSFFLPKPFQYFGLWLLVCFVLQAWFGWKLMSLISNRVFDCAVGTTFFIFAPPFLQRIAHMNLMGHFLILAALYLALKESLVKRKLVWGILLTVTALVHVYLLAMVALIWVFNWFMQIIMHKLPTKEIIFEFFFIISIVAFVSWQVGYFMTGTVGAAAYGFGLARMNLLAPFDSYGWSYILKSLPHGPVEYEGYNFFGLGFIILLCFALFAILTKRVAIRPLLRKNIFVLIPLILLAIFALSNQIGFGSYTFRYPIPFLEPIGLFFRSSGRMFWPVWYMIGLVVLFVVIRGYKRAITLPLLLVTLGIQIIDLHAGWQHISRAKAVLPSSEWSSPLQDPFWSRADQKYTKIINATDYPMYDEFLKSTNLWPVFAYYASQKNMGTDIVYVSRIPRTISLHDSDTSNFKNMFKTLFLRKDLKENAKKIIMGSNVIHDAYLISQKNLKSSFHNGTFAKDAIYVFDEKTLHSAKKIAGKNDLLQKIDGFYILAPNWYLEKL